MKIEFSSECGFFAGQEQMDVKFKKQFPTRKELEIVSSTRIWKREDKAARTLQNGWREYIRYSF